MSLVGRNSRLAAFWAWGVVVLAGLLAGCSTGPRLNPNEAATADAVPRYEAQPDRINPPSYTVNGRTYHVLQNNTGYDEQGVASWYGPQFHGKKTASGERYDMYAMTAAHKTLRIPCYARVTNLENGASVIVKVNDRGPFVSNRIIDLSYAAARKIGMLGRGTAMVDVQAITVGQPLPAQPVITEPNPPPSPAVPVPLAPPPSVVAALPQPKPVPRAAWGQDVYVQVGAFGDAGHVQAVRLRLNAAGITDVRLLPFGNLTRVRVGPVPSLEDYDRLMDQLRSIGFENAQMVVE
ncbi:septal ring lytic transglycosylase RlpA family protein [Halothiobacillus sp. DCM-1]|uniref:septal ring lytic transglycosylase RlpA family protein n=1 Tax=Halothiobacillus sp. DCM-1 TaxID=3112558 RepID=UPI00324956CE